MIIKTETRKGIKTFIVDKRIPDSKINTILNNFVKPSHIKNIITESCDVYTKDGKLLLKFRKDILNDKHVDDFYKNVNDFAHNWSSNRGNTSGVKKGTRNVLDNPHIMTNIFGYFDKWSPRQKFVFNKRKEKPLVDVRVCKFNMDSPEKYEKTIPLLEQISKLYKKLTPAFFKKQNDKTKQTHFRIGNTAFTTVTTNINFRTTVHRDKGDDEEGFGNLVVFEKQGKYTGGETCFPQYGIGVDVREGDFLLMDVHEPHGNLPIKKLTKDAERMSIVCYLRKGVWAKTKGKSKAFYNKHVKKLHELRRFALSGDKTKKKKKGSKKNKGTRKK
tara:strand:- start:239 stop:1228 length:990 start_codon:yes stop_codon:yes gene_type:complete